MELVGFAVFLGLRGGVEIGNADAELKLRIVGAKSKIPADHEIGHQVTFPLRCLRGTRICCVRYICIMKKPNSVKKLVEELEDELEELLLAVPVLP